jgi:hypothetical protein
METVDQDTPVLKETPGGWMAVAVDTPRIAVVADTKEAVLRQFRAGRAEWRELILQASLEASC